ncbi:MULTISPECIES: hypothetical protein [unclassified Rhizobium]|uniref:hypothetical protein n=1 Tax=unclassified Rhizobium TaxID=2613769 RepID=UPI001FEEC36A|nr:MULTISPECIES: hypothetical protein [unclassified Rhizobium]
MGKSEITAPIIGAARLQHLDDAVVAFAVRLSPAEIDALEGKYILHSVVGLT